MINCLTIIRIELEFGNVGFLRRGENRSTRRKTSRSKEENQQQTQPTYDAGSRNRTRDTFVVPATSPEKSLRERTGRRDLSHEQFTRSVLRNKSQGLVQKNSNWFEFMGLDFEEKMVS